MVYITKPIDIITTDVTYNDELQGNMSELGGDITFSLADSTDKDSVIDIKIGNELIGWISKEAAVDFAKAVIEQITPFITKEEVKKDE